MGSVKGRRASDLSCLSGWAGLLAIAALALGGCGGGGGGGGGGAATSTLHSVTLTWAANHETGVNKAGGGYRVSISGQATPINIPFNAASGVTPTTTTVQLYTGTYTATVTAYAALDVNGGTTGNSSAPSAPLVINVP